MTSRQYERVREIFADALDQPQAGRAAFLAAACGSDADLRTAVERLLQAHARSETFAPDLEPKPCDTTAPPGTMIGRYRVLDVLGEGGFGVVYRTEQLEPMRRQVALKVIKPGMDTREVVARFDTERQALALMNHPGIARVLDAGATESGHPYFVMELVSGTPITEYCDQRKLNLDQRLQLFVHVCRAVQHAHQKAILHRDLKPTNILVVETDGQPAPKIIDFGVAKALGGQLAGTTRYTRGDHLLGTPTYMSPEQAEGSETEADTRSDIYALGALLYELLTGTTPFDKETINRLPLDEVRRIVRETQPSKPSTCLQQMGDPIQRIAQDRRMDPVSLRKRLIGDLDWIVMKAMEKERQRRYDTAGSLAQDVERHLNHEPITARPPSRLYHLQRLIRRNRLTCAAGGALFLMFTVGGLFSTWQWRRAVASEVLARQQAYAADMNLAQGAMEGHDLGRARELLNRYRPTTGSGLDLRGWEWRYLWQQARGGQLETLMTSSNSISALAASSNGELLAVRERRCIYAPLPSDRISLWNMPRRQLVGELPCQGGHHAMAISDSLHLLAAAEFDFSAAGKVTGGSVRLYDLKSCQETGQLPHPAGVNAMALSPEGRYLATHGGDKRLRLWDLVAQEEIREWPASGVHETTWYLGRLLFSPDGNRLLFGDSWSREIRVIDLRTDEEFTLISPNYEEAHEAISALALSSDGRHLAVGYGFHPAPILLWDLEKHKCVHELAGHRTFVNCLSFTADGRTLASAALDQTLRLWDVESGRLKQVLTGHSDWIWALTALPDGKGFVSGSRDGTVRIWSADRAAAAKEPIRIQVRWQIALTPFVFLPDSRSFLSLDPDGTAVIRNVFTGVVQERIAALGTNHNAVGTSPDGHWVVVGGPAEHVGVWDRHQQIVVTNLSVAGGEVRAVSFDGRGRTLRVLTVPLSSGGATVRLLAIQDWRELDAWTIEQWAAWDIAWSPDDRLAVVGAKDGTITWLDADTGRVLERTQGPAAATSLAFSPDGRSLAAVSWVDRLMAIWDTRTRRVTGPALRVHLQAAGGLAFSPDGRRIATGGSLAEEGIKLWDTITRSPLITLPTSIGGINHLAFSPDGNSLIAGAGGKGPESFYLYLWHLPSLGEIDGAAAR